MNPELIEILQKRLQWLNGASSLVVDADTHISNTHDLSGCILEQYRRSPNYYHGCSIDAQELIMEMDMAQVDCALCWQNPATTPYTDDLQENFRRLLAANQYIHQSAIAYPQRILPAGWTDPKALGLEGALKLTDICVMQLGFPVIKLNRSKRLSH